MELDKFKRRLVRSVSHLLKQDQQPQEAAWEQMRKETGCDCKLLWQRMRALTIKKLKRLVVADDRSDNIATVARLSATDWLLFDLVLVHEKLDVIGRDQIGKGKGQTERPTMTELFELVLAHDIESKKGDELLDAWSSLAIEYNSNGRQVSPMLLQKRWFQLKEMTRANFYKLWNNYRGNQKLWDVAQLYKPTPLQAEIAKKFPQVITQPFPEWHELIEMEKVILLEQFETRIRMKNRPKTIDDKPDLVVIEPVIETIDLGAESDGENPSTSTTQPADAEVNLALVKQEPVDDCLIVKDEPIEDGLSNVQILATTHIPTEINEDSNSNSHLSSLALGEANRENLSIQMSDFMETTTLDDATLDEVAQHEATDVDDPDLSDDLIKQKADEYIRNKSKPLEPETEETPDACADKDDEKSDEVVDDIIKQKADDFVRKVDIKKLVHDVVDEFKLPEDISFEHEGIEFVDDGIEYNEEDDENADENKIKEEVDPVVKAEMDEESDEKVKKDEDFSEEKQNSNEAMFPPSPSDEENEDNEKEAGSPKFDLKLLMEPVVYTTKLDDMIAFKGKMFNFVQFQNIIDSVVIESKPVSQRAIKVEAEDHDDTLSQSNLSQSSKAASDDLFKTDSQSQLNENKDTITNDDLCKKILDTVNDDLFMKESHQPHDDSDNDNESDESEEEIDESLKVKASSCLLQKPRNRSYNPIILCKNPDFNTRLKRLTAGFFSSLRNRKLLSACKPMTIDLNKAFESKLVNGTLYLKSSEGTPQPVREQTDNEESTSVIPSAMPIQSLLAREKTNVNINDLLSSSHIDTVDLTQRSKTINLRDLSEIRRINQHLLTAQVPPMRVDSIDVSKSPPYLPQDNVVEEIIEDTAIKPIDDDKDCDEPKMIGVSSLQDVTQNTLAPEHDFREDFPKDRIFNSYRGRGRGRGSLRGGAGKKYGPQVSTATKPIDHNDHSDELKILGVAGRQDVSQSTLAPENEFGEDLPKDRILKPYRGRGRGAMGGGAGKKCGPVKPYVYPFASTKPTIAPWRIGLKPKPTNIDDNLITIDTLNRMINKLGGFDEYKNPKGKNKKPIWAIERNLRESLAKQNELPVDVTATAEAGGAATNTDVINVTSEPVETTPEATLDVSVQTAHVEPKKSKGVKRRKPRKKKYCCWSKEKLYKYGKNYKMVTTHECPPVCECCCRQDLIDEMKRRQNFRKRLTLDELKALACTESIQLSDEECDNKSDDSNDVRIPGFDPVEENPPVPLVRVSSMNKTDKCYKGRGVPLNVAGVSAMQPTVAAPQQPVMRINVSYIPAAPDPPPLSITQTVANSPALLEQMIARSSPSLPIPAPILTLNPSANRVNIPVALQQSTNTTKRQIVIDASGPIVAENIQDRMFYLNSKTISSKPKDSPIFLGKNKILLTTVKFPPNFNGENRNPVSPIQPSKITPTTLPLPAGVNLILMPDGQLNFTLDPNVQLDGSQLEVLPKIISAVQQQISSQIIAPTAENASIGTTLEVNSILSSNVIEGAAEVNSSINQEVPENQTTDKEQTRLNQAEVNNVGEESRECSKNTNTSAEPTAIDLPLSVNSANDVKESDIFNIDENSDAEVTNTSTRAPSISINSSNDANKLKESEIINIDENNPQETNTSSSTEAPSITVNASNDVNKLIESGIIITIDENNDPEEKSTSTANSSLTTNNAVNEGASCSRNLLSDLMEMSGISSDDVPQESAEKTQVAIPVVGNSSLPLVTAVVGPPPLIETIPNPVTQVATTTMGLTDRPEILPELSPITSLAELKYACENNGQFFKLDLDTGILAPINVCIKKNIKRQPRVYRHVDKSVLPVKSVIDLTDDGEKETVKNVSEDGTVKPIKLIKRFVYHPPNMLMKKKKAQQQTLSVENTRQWRLRQRKQNLEKIEAKIDLVDSDAPMEEEYLVESSDSDEAEKRPNTTEAISIPDVDSEYSSDEEPLAKKFMRLKQANSTLTQEPDKNSDAGKNIAEPKDKDATVTVTEAPGVPNAPTDVPVPVGPAKPNELRTENVNDNGSSDEMDISENVTDNVNPDDMSMDIEEAQFIPLLDENESQDEDCILGF